MPKRIVQTIIPSDGVFQFETTARAEGRTRGLRVAVPAAIVRGLVHVGWTGRWLDVRLDDARFRVAVRPHPTSVMFALPKKHRGTTRAGARITLEVRTATGPRAPHVRQVRGRWRLATPSLSLPWLRG